MYTANVDSKTEEMRGMKQAINAITAVINILPCMSICDRVEAVQEHFHQNYVKYTSLKDNPLSIMRYAKLILAA